MSYLLPINFFFWVRIHMGYSAVLVEVTRCHSLNHFSRRLIMRNNIPVKPLAALIGSALAASLVSMPAANADENPFSMTQLSSGYMIADAEGKCGEKKTEEGNCGEKKAHEGDSGESKHHEGSCGGQK
jgi:uncharacterized low-complexity protein